MRIQSKLGYVWAALGIPIMLVFIMGMDFWMGALFINPGVTHSKRITGGEIKTVIDYGGYAAQIHEPVFEGLFRDSNRGFVQLDWIAEEAFPDRITEVVDYDSDGTDDFLLELNTVENTARLTAFHDMVQSLSDEGVFVFENQRKVRVTLVKGET